ncbi:hypothetical protein BE221DRAFT_143961 [Ostreococcus tauri]|uniref:O-acyltransferase WSD1 C-terminal domain-containing protein n=1 Tax=Ostreococcus tauri TaxID=70448 RepID=A0A1Y5IHL0_OSTTA|nr:hypothetical protein BE221DRAFT_143961 [Ostreococcus tauri]
MNSLTETLARATLRGATVERSRRARRLWISVGRWILPRKAPSDDEIKTFVDALEAFPELRSAATPRDSKSVKNLRHLRWECVEDVGNVKAMRGNEALGTCRHLGIHHVYICVYVRRYESLAHRGGPYDTKTTFKGSRPPYGFSGKRRVVVCPPVAIDDIKAIKNVSGCTVNDIVVAALAGAIQAYHAKKDIDFMKRSPEPYVTRWLNKFVNAAGPDVQRKVVFDYMSRHSMVFTNVPGPTETSCSWDLAVVSYSGSLRLTLVVDPDATPDAQYIGDMFKNEIECLRKEVL